MPALAALVLLASSTTTMHVEDVFPGTMVCTCTPTPSSAVPASAVTEEPSYWRSPTAWTIASGATSLVLIGGSIAAHLHSTGVNGGLPGSGPWSTASTAMLVGGSVLAGFSAAFLVMRF
jgi:hypothetical protein